MICQYQTIKCCSIKYTFTFSWNCIDPIDPIDPTDPHQIQDWLCPLCPLCLAQEGCPGRTDSATAKGVLCLRYHRWSCSVLASVTVNSNANVFSLNGHNAMTFHPRGKLKLPSYNQVLPHARQATETFISATHWHTLANWPRFFSCLLRKAFCREYIEYIKIQNEYMPLQSVVWKFRAPQSEGSGHPEANLLPHKLS